jgi:transcriptional regulator with XRE-family HTH domain
VPKEDSSLTVEEEAFADEMRRLREDKGWSQEKLAEHVQVHGPKYVNQSTISRIEKKTRQVRLAEAQAIAHVFNRSVESMTGPSELMRTADQALRYVNAARDRFTNLKYHLEEFDEDYRTVLRNLRELAAMVPDPSHVPPVVAEAIEKCDRYVREAAPDLQDPWVARKVAEAAETHL